MEHFRSTLATTAIAVFGLVVAGYSLHSGHDAVQARPVAVAAQPAAWTDPPARLSATETTGTIRTDLRGAAISAPQQVAAMPPVAAPLPGPMAEASEPLRKPVSARRSKANERAAHRSARLRHAALARTAAVERAAPATAQSAQAAPAAASRIATAEA
jgi:hypothetical protein